MSTAKVAKHNSLRELSGPQEPATEKQVEREGLPAKIVWWYVANLNGIAKRENTIIV